MIAFVVLMMLLNLCLWIAADVSKIKKIAQHDLTFILVKLSESVISFAWLSLVLATENIVSFIKLRLYWKRGCLSMRIYKEMFSTNISNKLA